MVYLKTNIRFNNNYKFTKLYFATLSVSSGTATLRFKSTIGAGTIQGAALSGDYIVGKRKQIIYMNK